MIRRDVKNEFASQIKGEAEEKTAKPQRLREVTPATQVAGQERIKEEKEG